MTTKLPQMNGNPMKQQRAQPSQQKAPPSPLAPLTPGQQQVTSPTSKLSASSVQGKTTASKNLSVPPVNIIVQSARSDSSGYSSDSAGSDEDGEDEISSAAVTPSQSLQPEQQEESKTMEEENDDEDEDYEDEDEYDSETMIDPAEDDIIENESESEQEDEYLGPGGGNRPHLSVSIWDQLCKLVKDDKVKAVQDVYGGEIKKDSKYVPECLYVNRQDALGNTLLFYVRSTAMTHFLCSFPNTNLELQNQQGASSLWHHMDLMKDKKTGGMHRAIARALVENGADIFFRNVLKHQTAIELCESKELTLQLRRLANAKANRVADPLLTGPHRDYYKAFFDVLDTDHDGIVKTDDIIKLWFRARNEQLFIDAVNHPEIIEQQLTLPPRKKPKPAPKKGEKAAPPPKPGKKSTVVEKPLPLTEEDKLEQFISVWDIDLDGKFSFPDFVRFILEFDRTSTPEMKFQSAMLVTPRVAGSHHKGTSRTSGRGSVAQSRRPSAMLNNGGQKRSRRSSMTTTNSARMKQVASMMSEVNIFAMTQTQELKEDMVVVDDSTPGTPTTAASAAADSKRASATSVRASSQSRDSSARPQPSSVIPSEAPSTQPSQRSTSRSSLAVTRESAQDRGDAAARLRDELDREMSSQGPARYSSANKNLLQPQQQSAIDFPTPHRGKIIQHLREGSGNRLTPSSSMNNTNELNTDGGVKKTMSSSKSLPSLLRNEVKPPNQLKSPLSPNPTSSSPNLPQLSRTESSARFPSLKSPPPQSNPQSSSPTPTKKPYSLTPMMSTSPTVSSPSNTNGSAGSSSQKRQPKSYAKLTAI